MTLAAFLLLSSSALLNTPARPVYVNVSIGAYGPYRFLLDTGAQTNLIDARLAEELRLEPQFRVEIVTQNSSRLWPGLRISSLRAGSTALPEVELVFHDLAEARRTDPSIRGLLGLSALAGLNFAISPSSHRLELSPDPPPGEVIPFYQAEGRIAVKARMGRETLTLIVDSGASHLVLFRLPEAMAETPPIESVFTTLDGARSAVPTCWTAEMSFSAGLRIGTLPAAIVNRKDTSVDGLLPAAIFRKIYVDQRRGELVLIR
jgi:hypothetical protein